MTDPLTNGQHQGQHPRRSRRVMAAGALAAALAVGGGVSIAAAASPAHPAAAAGSAQAVAATTGASSAPTTTSGSSAAPKAGSRPTPPAHQPHLGGTVMAVGSGTITIKDRDGFRRQIKTSSKTGYSDGLKSPVAVGTQIEAEGTVDANGTALDATAIRKAPQPGDGAPGRGGPGRGVPGRGGFGRGPMGGPSQGGSGRHDGSAPTPPSGAPAAPSGAPSASTSAAPTS